MHFSVVNTCEMYPTNVNGYVVRNGTNTDDIMISLHRDSLQTMALSQNR